MSIQYIAKAQAHVNEILETIVPQLLTKGVSEKEVADKLENILRKEGAFELAFPIICAFTEGAAEPHHEPRADRHLRVGDSILIDCGVKHKGWCSDVTRMFSLGEPSKEFREKYEKVLRIHEVVLSQFLPGKEVTELDQFVRNELGEDEKFFIHGLGHGVGKEVHEEPRITSVFKKTPPPKVPAILKEGMVVTCEPGLYYPDKFGIRIEDIFVVRENGPEMLSKTSRELHVLKS
jgi:Xaa-Pro aminopeptidase